MPRYEDFLSNTFENPFTSASWLGRADILEWLLGNGIFPFFFSIVMACFIGNEQIIKLLDSHFDDVCAKFIAIFSSYKTNPLNLDTVWDQIWSLKNEFQGPLESENEESGDEGQKEESEDKDQNEASENEESEDEDQNEESEDDQENKQIIKKRKT
jgi:hypothetical protein